MKFSLHGCLLAAGSAVAFSLGVLLPPSSEPQIASEEKKTTPSPAPVEEEKENDGQHAATPDAEPDVTKVQTDAPVTNDEESTTDVEPEAEETPDVDSKPETEETVQSTTEQEEEVEEPKNVSPAEEALTEQVEPLKQIFPARSNAALLPNRSASATTAIVARLRLRIQASMLQELKRIERDKPCEKRQVIAANRWAEPESLYKQQAAKLLQELGKAGEENCIAAMERGGCRQVLMQSRVLVWSGFDSIRRICRQEKGAPFLEKLSANEDWLSDLLYSGSVQSLSAAISHLNTIYLKHASDMEQSVLRRIATAVALEFAGDAAGKDDMLARYELYRAGYTQGKLNKIVQEMPCWQLRYVMSMPESQKDACTWGSPKNLAWLRDNVKLPIGEYTKAYTQLDYQLRNVAGDSVYSTDYLAPGLRHADFIVALAQRDSGGGASGAQSYYAAYAAAANGIPAVIVSEPGHYSYAVRTLQGWRAANSRHWNRKVHKTLWGKPTWGFLQLSENIQGNRAVSRTADLMLSLADFLAEQEKIPQAGRLYEAVIQYQPLHWPALVRYAAFLRDRAANDDKKWYKLHEFALSGIGKRNYSCAAQYLVEHVYPGFLPHVPDAVKRVKLFENLYNQFNGWGENRWDIAPLLTAQVQSFREDGDKKQYLQRIFDVLMKKQGYSAAVLIWGLEYMNRLQQEESSFCDEVEKVLTLSLRRSKGGSSHEDTTWTMLGEVCYSAAQNRDIAAFQLAGNMAYKRCRKKFPEHGRLDLPKYNGFLCSSSGLVYTHGAQTTEQMEDACLHWAVLQSFGGMMPVRFENKQGVLVQLKKSYELAAVLCVFTDDMEKGRDFYLEISDDGRTWLTEPVQGKVADNILQFELPRKGVHARFVRVLREGDRSEATITHLQIYGK